MLKEKYVAEHLESGERVTGYRVMVQGSFTYLCSQCLIMGEKCMRVDPETIKESKKC